MSYVGGKYHPHHTVGSELATCVPQIHNFGLRLENLYSVMVTPMPVCGTGFYSFLPD